MASESISPQEQEQLLKQYEILREELAAADSQNYKVTAGVFTACSVILITGFQQLQAAGADLSRYWLCFLIFLTSLTVSIPGYRILLGNRKRVWRIATYMTTFVEPLLAQLKWETRVQKLRKVEDAVKNKQSSGRRSLFRRFLGGSILTSSDVIANEILLMAFFTGIACVGLLLSLIGISEWLGNISGISPIDTAKNLNDGKLRVLTIAIICIVLAISIFFKAKRDIKSESRTGSSRSDMEERWKTVKDEEE
jgi:hypothetical protein